MKITCHINKDALTLGFVITAGSGEAVRIRVAPKISTAKLVGSWESEDGETGALEMTRKKEAIPAETCGRGLQPATSMSMPM